jgi:CelD/BcsL family acetyltransferase involved in cellulose biosynthesis
MSLRRGAICYKLSEYNHYYVDTRLDFDKYLAKFKAKTRSTLRRKVQRLADTAAVAPLQHHAGAFQKFRTPRELDTFLKLAHGISPKTYQQRLFGQGIPTTEAFRSSVLRKANDGLARGYVLFSKGVPIAYTYCPMVRNRVLLYDYNGYDQQYSKLSPGTVMQYKIIEDLCNDPDIDLYDLCVGEDEHKYHFSTGSHRCADVVILEVNSKSMCSVVAHFVTAFASRQIGQALRSVGIKTFVKRLIRRNAFVSSRPSASSSDANVPVD